jgi:hypothetical protein
LIFDWSSPAEDPQSITSISTIMLIIN